MLGKLKGAAVFVGNQIDVRDVVLLAGLLLAAAGLYQVYVPLAFVVPGAILTYIAIRPQSKVDE